MSGALSEVHLRAVRDIFVPGIGQYENIGDIILRRQLLRWLRPLGRLHVYIGPAPAGYDDGLQLAPSDLVYRSFRDWYRAAMSRARTGTASYVFKPGEIQLTLPGLKEHLAMLPLVWRIRRHGGAVLRVGAGARNFSWFPRLLMAPSLRGAHRTWWRDGRTAAYLGAEVMPDLAFGEGDETPDWSPERRNLLIVSMRGDRAGVSDAWIEAIRGFAARHNLDIHTVTQVERDASLSRDLARRLGDTFLEWNGTDHAAKEEELNSLYRRARIAVSDRLHVLIAAYIHGAMPVALQMNSSDKIRRHFKVIGVDGIVHDCRALPADDIESILERVPESADMLHRALPAARAMLAEVRREVVRVVTQESRIGES